MGVNEFNTSILKEIRKCKICNRFKDFIFLKIHDGVKIFINKNGSRWCGRLCPKCRNIRDVKRTRLKGIHKSIDDVSAPHIKKSRYSERLAQKYLHLMGMRNIKLTTATGPDIIFLDIDDEIKTCEVKTILKDPKSNSYFTTPVTKKRINDDYFIAIFPNKEMLMESMCLHHKKAAKCGRRNFTMETLYG